MATYRVGVPAVGRMSQDRGDVLRWVETFRALFKDIPVRVYQRTLSAGGLNERIFVAVVYPKIKRS